MKENGKNNRGAVLIIGLLVVLVIGVSAFMIYDKILLKDKENNSDLVDFDISKFDTTKPAINGSSNVTYNPYTGDEAKKMGLSVKIGEDKRSAILMIDWAKYGPKYGTSLWSTETIEYPVTNFNQNITEVYISGFGQVTGYETAFYIMEDGTVEYTPIMNALGNNGASKDTVLKSYGKIFGVSGVVKIIMADMMGEIGGGISVLGIKSDGSFYDLSNILYETDYYQCTY